MENIRERYEALAKWNFTDKETYLDWVSRWKDFYKELSQHIRDTRLGIRNTQRNGELPGWRVYMNLTLARHYATAALLLRRNCKKEAAYQVMIVMQMRPVELAERLHDAAESGELEHVGVIGSTILVEKEQP